MKGDFSRLTFEPSKRYTAVLMQQGRVTLDSDWNEQVAIREHVERIRFEDVVGGYGVPHGEGFAVHGDRNGALALSAGRIYAGGLLCELIESTPLERLVRRPLAPRPGRTDLVFLDAWERHVTALDDPDLLEPALGGADTTTRLQVVWKIDLVENVGDRSSAEGSAALPKKGTAAMRVATPDGYSGSENHLYRVEIHDGSARGHATFKWSRDNGSVVFAVEDFVQPSVVRVTLGLPRTPQKLAVGDWVEVSSDESELAGQVGTLARVEELSEDGRSVLLDRDVSPHRNETHARLRRWDQRNGPAVPVSSDWIPLEAGVQVRFSGSDFQPGDYWTIPARPADVCIEWPAEEPPQGIEHQLCPLALVQWKQAGETCTPVVRDCRRAFLPLTEIHTELARLKSEIAELRRQTPP